MHEIVITSGKHNLMVDPTLTIWGWPIPVYLFLGGLVSGILFFSTFYYLRGKQESMRTVVRVTPLFAPFLLALGLLALFTDLDYKLHVFRFYMAIRLKSPMSWGSWTLAAIFPLSVFWASIHVESVFKNWRWPYRWMENTVSFFREHGTAIAWITMVYSLLLGMYTGILLSAFNARPFWNTAILGPLFLVSGLSTGVALNILFSKNPEEEHLLNKIDVMAIGVEVFLIIHLFMGLLASSEVKIQAAKLFLGGPYTAVFWVLVVGLGLLFPALLELLEINNKVAKTKISALLVLAGGLLLRFVIVGAGQFTHWVF